MEKKARLKRSDWLTAALAALTNDGIDAVRIERLARDLGVTKGSFYWHFQDRDALLEALLDHWDTVCTLPVIEAVNALDSSPRDRLEEVEHIIEGLGTARSERAMLAWAQHDSRARDHLQGVIENRLAFVLDLFQRAGFRGDEAEVRARMFFYRQLGRLYFDIHEDELQREFHARIRLRLLTEPPR